MGQIGQISRYYDSFDVDLISFHAFSSERLISERWVMGGSIWTSEVALARRWEKKKSLVALLALRQ